MLNILEILQGKKTYIISVVGALINVLEVFEVLDLTNEQLFAINGLILALLGATLRAGIKKG